MALPRAMTSVTLSLLLYSQRHPRSWRGNVVQLCSTLPPPFNLLPEPPIYRTNRNSRPRSLEKVVCKLLVLIIEKNCKATEKLRANQHYLLLGTMTEIMQIKIQIKTHIFHKALLKNKVSSLWQWFVIRVSQRNACAPTLIFQDIFQQLQLQNSNLFKRAAIPKPFLLTVEEQSNKS